jgi:hypothetical protein
MKLTTRTNEIKIPIDRELKRDEIVQSSTKLLALFAQAALLSKDAESEIANLKVRVENLSRLENIPLTSRNDYSEDLKSAESALVDAKQLEVQIANFQALLDKQQTLHSRIPQRRDLLDKTTTDQLSELDTFVKATNAHGLPTSAKDLYEAGNGADALLSRLDSILKHAAIIQNGRDYAHAGETSWRVLSKQDPMTDRVEVSVESMQRNEQGANAAVTGFCNLSSPFAGEVNFSALIVDDLGNGIDLPQAQSWLGHVGTGATVRINDFEPQERILPHKGNFTNELLIASLAKKDTKSTDAAGRAFLNLAYQTIPVSDIWRIYVQFETSRQKILVKIPMYDPAIQKMISACIGD